MTLRRLAALLVLALPASILAGQDSSEQRPRDAAEAVKEGDVSQWLKYYQRERGTPAQQPARSPEPAVPEPKGEEPAAKR